MNSFALLTRADREAVLRDAQVRLDIPPFIVEKDFWVCWTLARIFGDAEIANAVLFKGGTSLSKVFRVIDRFSEDVDLGVAPARLGFDEQQLNESPSKTRRQRDMDALGAACAQYVEAEVVPKLEDSFAQILGRPKEKARWLTYEFDKVTSSPVVLFAYLMTRGLKVAGGDRLGKTIVFAKNHEHALFIAQRFDANYPHLRGEFARVIDFKVEYAQTLIDEFGTTDKPPHIAISVDMLDTGIDVPDVVNLVFFKLVRSKTKFWQMLGRGTRLRPDLFGPGAHKQCFYVFDFCQNLEFFAANPETTDGAAGESLGTRLFATRVELLGALDEHFAQAIHEAPPATFTLADVRRDHAAWLTEHGLMETSALYASPFTDVSPRGPEALFGAAAVDELIAVLGEVRRRAAA